MKKMFVFAIVALAAFLGAAPSNAKADYVYDWSFSNTIGNVDGTVSGTVTFSDISAGTHAANSLIITSAPAELGFSLPIETINWYGQDNSFTFNGAGQIFDADYNRSPDFLGPIGIQLNYYGQNFLSYNGYVYNPSGMDGLTFTPHANPTPEPASLALLAAGAPCMMLVRRLRKKASV